MLVGEGIESAACMYNVGPGGWVLYAAALKCEVICQGCAAVLIEKLIYIRRFAHAAVPIKELSFFDSFRLWECEIRTRLDLVIVI